MRQDQPIGPPRQTVRTAVIDGRVALYDSASRQASVLNETASSIWQQCDGTRTRVEIVRELATTFGVREAEIAGDVNITIDEFLSGGLLEPARARATPSHARRPDELSDA